MKYLKAKCLNCNTVFVAMSDRHRLDECPGCKESYVDYEEHYCRFGGPVKIIEHFEPPWFEDEDDYHSALLGWLNYDGQEFTLGKWDGILYVMRRSKHGSN